MVSQLTEMKATTVIHLSKPVWSVKIPPRQICWQVKLTRPAWWEFHSDPLHPTHRLLQAKGQLTGSEVWRGAGTDFELVWGRLLASCISVALSQKVPFPSWNSQTWCYNKLDNCVIMVLQWNRIALYRLSKSVLLMLGLFKTIGDT